MKIYLWQISFEENVLISDKIYETSVGQMRFQFNIIITIILIVICIYFYTYILINETWVKASGIIMFKVKCPEALV